MDRELLRQHTARSHWASVGQFLPRAIRVVVVAVLFVPLALTTGPAITTTLHTAAAFATLPRHERRARILGTWTRAADDLSRRLSPRASIDLVLADAPALEIGPFLAGNLVPHPLWCYDGWPAWRARVPERIIRDDRGVNAASAPLPRSDVIVLVDTRRDPTVQVVDRATAERLAQ
jgi:hypothetical protein